MVFWFLLQLSEQIPQGFDIGPGFLLTSPASMIEQEAVSLAFSSLQQIFAFKHGASGVARCALRWSRWTCWEIWALPLSFNTVISDDHHHEVPCWRSFGSPMVGIRSKTKLDIRSSSADVLPSWSWSRAYGSRLACQHFEVHVTVTRSAVN